MNETKYDVITLSTVLVGLKLASRDESSSVPGAHSAWLEAEAVSLVRQRQPHDTLRSADTVNTEAWESYESKLVK